METNYFFSENHKIPESLEPTSYFAFIDNVEIYEKGKNGKVELRLDCVEIEKIHDNISSEELSRFPSIIITLNESKYYFQNIFKRGYLAYLDGIWIKFTTKQNKNSNLHVSYLGLQLNNAGIDVENITLINNLKSEEKEKFNKLKKSLKLSNFAKIAKNQDFERVLELSKQFSSVAVYNVGQGNLNAMCDSDNAPLVYYDMGGGFGPNANTYPTTLRICTSYNPIVILSHWDLDHIETALRNNQSHSLTWYVPDQLLGLTHFILAYRIHQTGSIFIINSSQNTAHFSIIKSTGKGKNNSGLAILINRRNYKVLLPGDANYRFLNLPHEIILDGLVATHHGSHKGLTYYRKNMIPLAKKINMLAFSYGHGNTHSHNPKNVIDLYQEQNWAIPPQNHYLETNNGHILMSFNPVNMLVPCIGHNCGLTIVQHY